MKFSTYYAFITNKIICILLLGFCLLSAQAFGFQKSRLNFFKDQEERGMFASKILIRTLPTKAMIYINDREIGESPVTITLKHEDKRMYNIKAVPVYPNQYTQNIFLMVPPLPKTMTIYMNHYPEDYDRDKDKPFTPPKKPEPKVITQVDTVYVEKRVQEVVTFELPVIYFDTSKWDILAQDEPKLQTLIESLKQHPELKIEAYGFADKRAPNDFNITLSLNRANAVKDYLVKNGIDPKRISTFGHGKVTIVGSDGVEMDLATNRKVIFILRK